MRARDVACVHQFCATVQRLSNMTMTKQSALSIMQYEHCFSFFHRECASQSFNIFRPRCFSAQPCKDCILQKSMRARDEACVHQFCATVQRLSNMTTTKQSALSIMQYEHCFPFFHRKCTSQSLNIFQPRWFSFS